jgi:RNA polymerase-binding transcription factor DksA
MTWGPRTVTADAPLDEAARALADGRIGCLPVLDGDGRLIGIFSETDALRALVAALRGAPASGAEPGAAAPGLVAELEDERRRIADQLARWQAAERDLSADLHDEPRDAADRAFDEHEVARIEPLSERASRRLRAIEVALERAAQGRFGRCERCSRPIAPGRLRALPETTLCARCARGEGPGRAAES